MLFTILKIIAASLLVIGVPKISQCWPSMSGVIGAMPIFSLLFLLCVYSENGGEGKIVEYSATAAIGMVPACLLYLGIFYALDKGGTNLPGAICFGTGLWFTTVIIYQMLLRAA